jgi:nitroreductase
MNISEAISSRFSVRAFLDGPVSEEQIHRILNRARQAPSGGNLQPWHVYVVAGQPFNELKALIRARSVELPQGEEPEYAVYPPNLPEPYRSRRFKCGEDLYAAIGIKREDKLARIAQFAKNLGAFGAPMVLYFAIDRFMGVNQWAHLGMFMQTIMLLATEEGLDTCAQESWSAFHDTISNFIELPDEQMIYCGMAMGYADREHPINQWRTERAPLKDVARFIT